MRIAIVSQTEILEELRTTFGEDPLIRDALLRCDPDAQVDIVDWRDDSINWYSYDGIFVSSTWNNTLHPKDFITWLDHCESDGTKRLINDKSWLLLNFIKGQYLQHFRGNPDLANSLIPTAIIKKPLSLAALSARLTALDPAATQFVCKPEVAIGGDDTHIVTRHDAAAIGRQISSILKKYPLGGVMLQPFIDSISTKGEYQLLYINGTFSHAIVKPPGFKNYDRDNFTLLEASMLPDTMQEVAERFVKTTSVNGQPLVRLRLDFVLSQDSKPLLLEAEGIEPRNNLLCLPAGELREAATSKLADAIAQRTAAYQHSARSSRCWWTIMRLAVPAAAALSTYAALRKAPPSVRAVTSLFAGITSACALSFVPALYKPSPQSTPKP